MTEKQVTNDQANTVSKMVDEMLKRKYTIEHYDIMLGNQLNIHGATLAPAGSRSILVKAAPQLSVVSR